MIIADARQSQWTYHYANRHDLASPADILNATNALNNSGGIQPHLKKNNWLFADGHVATLNVEDTCRQPRNNNNPRKYWSIDPND
jgi:prepilin-type processing-associated H-X9-DG protein